MHLPRFEIRGREYGLSREGSVFFHCQKVRIGDLKLRRMERFTYEYDRWLHDLRLEATLPVNQRKPYPVFVGGKCSAPPEDCGPRPRAVWDLHRQQPVRHRQLQGAASVWERISTGFVEATINQLVAKRFVKKQLMRRTPRGAHLLLQMQVTSSMTSSAPPFSDGIPSSTVREGSTGGVVPPRNGYSPCHPRIHSCLMWPRIAIGGSRTFRVKTSAFSVATR